MNRLAPLACLSNQEGGMLHFAWLALCQALRAVRLVVMVTVMVAGFVDQLVIQPPPCYRGQREGSETVSVIT